MSGQPNIHSLFTNPAFSALEVEPGEDTEEEELPEEVEERPVETKPSKAALKKAARQAHLEEKRQKRAEARKRRVEERQHSQTPDALLTSEDPSNGFALTHAPPSAAPVLPDVEAASSSQSVPVASPQLEPEVVSEPVPQPPGESISTHDSPVRKSERPLNVAYASSAPEETDVEKTEPEATPIPNDVTTVTEPQHQREAAAEVEKLKKRQNALTRTIWTLIMIGGFIGLLLMGHVYMIILVMVCQTVAYREVTALFGLATTEPSIQDKHSLEAKDPWSKTLNWYFFAVTNYFLYGESIIYYFKHVVFADAQLVPFITNHRMISFTLYVIGFMGFVMSLKKGFLKQQFGLFCWVHMTLLMIVVSSHFVINNILEGMIWFWVPASLVICNDVFAYIWGITLGRTPLIQLSPKKTVEGFVGAFFSTLIFALFWGTLFMGFNYMTCPVHDLGVSAWNSVQCKPNPVFVWRELPLWRPVAIFVSTLIGRTITAISYAPYHFHLLLMACFASLVAPFGGFFASGFKRAFKIKDFGQSIPGHGGMTDRMDCQFLMGVFTYVYYSSLIREHHVTVGSILQTIVSGLTIDEQIELIADLHRYLETQGIVVP